MPLILALGKGLTPPHLNRYGIYVESNQQVVRFKLRPAVYQRLCEIELN